MIVDLLSMSGESQELGVDVFRLCHVMGANLGTVEVWGHWGRQSHRHSCVGT